MGVCKCKKRTDLWCYKTVKPVCLDCIVDIEHQLSCVAPYVDWLNNPHEQESIICPLTNTPIVDASNSIRFTNLQVFHLDAIFTYCSQFSSNTAVAGFTIPGTEIPILPPINDQSKLAQQIREKLKGSPEMLRLLDSQKEILLNQTNIYDESSSVLSRKNARSNEPSESFAIQMESPSSHSTNSVTLRTGKRQRISKRIRTFLKGLKLKSCLLVFVLMVVIVYLFFMLFQKTLNLVEYELFSWKPSEDVVAGIFSHQIPDNIIQNS